MIRTTFIALAAATAFSGTAFAQDMDIVDTGTAARGFTTLLAAAESARLSETPKGEGPLTIFAPTDEAFAALPEGTVDSLLLPENQDQPADILTYHVVEGAMVSGDLTDGMEATAVNGGMLTISTGDAVRVSDATVTTPAIEASKGVIHVIDTVLMPAS